MRKLLDIPLDVVGSGLHPGLNPESAPFWADSRNVHFTKYGAQGMRGLRLPQADTIFFDAVAGLFDSAAGPFDEGGGGTGPLVSPATKAIRGLMAYRLSTGLPRTVFGTVNKIWKWDGGLTADEVQAGLTGHPDEQASVGVEATFISLTNWGDWFVATNNIDPIKIYKTGASMTNLIGTPPTRAKLLAKLGPHVIAFNIPLGANYMAWCAEDDIEEWDVAVKPTAGNLPIRDLENPIEAVVPLGETLAIYSRNEMQVLSYLGGIFQFGSRPMVEDIGALSNNSVVSIGPRNFGLYFNSIFQTDGFSKATITDREFARWFQKHVNLSQKTKIVGWHEAKLNQIRWAIPIDGSNTPNFQLGYNYSNGAFSFYDQSITMAYPPGVFDFATVGTPSGKLFWTESSDETMFDGGPINSYLISKPLHLDAPSGWKTLQYINLILKDLVSEDLQLFLGWQARQADPVQWWGPYAVNAENWEKFPGNFGFVYLTIKLVANSSAAQWTLEQIKSQGVPAGKEF